MACVEMQYIVLTRVMSPFIFHAQLQIDSNSSRICRGNITQLFRF